MAASVGVLGRVRGILGLPDDATLSEIWDDSTDTDWARARDSALRNALAISDNPNIPAAEKHKLMAAMIEPFINVLAKRRRLAIGDHRLPVSKDRQAADDHIAEAVSHQPPGDELYDDGWTQTTPPGQEPGGE